MGDFAGHPPDYYDTLGLERGATAEEVKNAYRLRSHMFHPDKYENYPEPLRTQLKSEAAKEFKKITTAYDVLRDPAKRAAHDRALNPVGSSMRERRAGGPTPRRAARSGRGASRATATEEAPRAARASGRRAAGAAPPRPRERDPLLVVRPEKLDFGTMALGTTKQLPLKIANAGGRTLFGEITSNRAWLSVNRRSFISSSAILFVSIDTSGLRPGEEYAGSLAVTTLNGGDQMVPVVVLVSGQPEPILAGAPSLLDFGVAQPGSTKARTIKLTNAGTGVLIGSVAVKGSWLAVTESRFRGNTASFEVIANTAGLRAGDHQGEVLIFSNGGRAVVQVWIEVPALPPGSTIVGAAPEGREPDGDAPAGEATDSSGVDAGAGRDEQRSHGQPRLSPEEQRTLLQRIVRIEPATVWEGDFLRRIVQLIRAGDRLAPGELAKIYELEARCQDQGDQEQNRRM
ncbi:MAG: J domain-containing protein [Chloroflexi bacterium]|nr:J domain-containing protein [Chloroflexota bacterium]